MKIAKMHTQKLALFMECNSLVAQSEGADIYK